MIHKLRIPTKETYAYIETEFEGSAEEAVAEYRRISDLINRRDGSFEEVLTFTGEKILYDRVAHRYTTLDGKPLISGSAYKKSLEKPFPEHMAGTIAKKYGVSEADIRAMWGMNSFCSSKFGDALHKAMELYRKYGHLAETLKDKQYFLPKNGTLKKAVLAFPLDSFAGHSEIMVSAVELCMVGQIDWLTELAPKEGIVEDYKSDMEVKKNLAGHFNQLSFYARILQHHGWKIEKVRVWNWDGEKWTPYDSDVLPVTPTPM